jgi:diguanylate cyclase (GGDEF)-like protein
LEEKIKKLEKDLAKSKEESSRDHLTGLLTRRAYDEEIEKFDEHYIRDKQDYALVFFDLDFFKKVNDTYGHDCGDVVLKTFAQILLKLTRKTNIVGRFGGEEFIAAIKYNDEAELIKYLKRIKILVTTNKFKYEDLKLDITFSAGVDLRSNHDSYEDVLKQTDALLYDAKEAGRNQIHLASGTIIK